ncbi:hypothetical protein KGQ20_02550 [Catenulispora sp. NF23]|uniref:hypothetical protein n=1 Tax=Catenulispora pinistramenti TaxID=2705254 RepID=UPI001BA66F87|nr:hypothetical protein [Catenulispora pinistramenti]MBS2531645.1 hypothetical protein [Catenulispora pinistramenti]
MNTTTVRIKLAPFGAHQVTLSLEPTGMTFDLQPSDWFIVEIVSQDPDLIEIGHNPEYIAIGTVGVSLIRVYDREGQLVHETDVV